MPSDLQDERLKNLMAQCKAAHADLRRYVRRVYHVGSTLNYRTQAGKFHGEVTGHTLDGVKVRTPSARTIRTVPFTQIVRR